MSQDPTRTATLRKNYSQRLRGPFRAIMAAIREGVEERDVLDVGPGYEGMEQSTLDEYGITPVPSYSLNRNDAKHDEFMSWLEQQQQGGVLDVIDTGENVFVRDAYRSGLRHGGTQLRKAGATPGFDDVENAFNAPVHRDTLEMMYSRNYRALEGITNAVDREVSRALTEGFSEGLNPRELGRNLRDRVEKIGITRANTMAQTEVIRTHAEATLNTYERAGIREVKGRAEFRHAGDSRVCDQCRALQSNVYTIDEARGLIPVHPRCRCVFLPKTSASDAEAMTASYQRPAPARKIDSPGYLGDTTPEEVREAYAAPGGVKV